MARILRAEWQGLATGMDGVFAGVDGYQVIRFITGWSRHQRIGFYSLVACTTVWSASSNIVGSFLPRFCALLSMPEQAFSLK
jgi:hypothetical protein